MRDLFTGALVDLFAGGVGVDRVLVVDAACDCAAIAAARVTETALRESIERVIDLTRRYVRGEVTWAVVAKARHAMWAAVVAAADAAAAAAAAATAATVYASRVVGHPAVCSAIRARIPVEIIKAALAAKESSDGR